MLRCQGTGGQALVFRPSVTSRVGPKGAHDVYMTVSVPAQDLSRPRKSNPFRSRAGRKARSPDRLHDLLLRLGDLTLEEIAARVEEPLAPRQRSA